MEMIVNKLISALENEVDSISYGHPLNKDNVAFMKKLVTLCIYAHFIVLDDKEVFKIMNLYEHS